LHKGDRIQKVQSTIELFKKIESMHPELEKIYIIRDNAKYTQHKVVFGIETDFKLCLVRMVLGVGYWEELWVNCLNHDSSIRHNCKLATHYKFV
jgi:hypothetical protein